MKTDYEKLSVARITLQLLILSEILPDELRPLIDRTIAEIKPTTPKTDSEKLTITRAALAEVVNQYAGFPHEVLAEIAPDWLPQVMHALTETEPDK